MTKLVLSAVAAASAMLTFSALAQSPAAAACPNEFAHLYPV